MPSAAKSMASKVAEIIVAAALCRRAEKDDIGTATGRGGYNAWGDSVGRLVKLSTLWNLFTSSAAAGPILSAT